jgi:hypothetical protein
VSLCGRVVLTMVGGEVVHRLEGVFGG